ncbi:hypothetical protein SADUNF_Sadunf05G0064100 [Salix dunnii]|uniref:Uncharacterized protein n=1 Tax=Salix dunnii TaxID=1413687 RepID=A0A835K9V9_9ROSI|nr:hypothetical protein SADUNF_Sadunf05G0064100 [Salix dunnii]
MNSNSVSRILRALMNEIPATSRKYLFALAMADKIMDGVIRNPRMELAEVNRMALSSAFARTLSLLYRSGQNPQARDDSSIYLDFTPSLPLGSYIASYVKAMSFCLSAVLQTVVSGSWQSERRAAAEREICTGTCVDNQYKLRDYGAVDEASVQWSYASVSLPLPSLLILGFKVTFYDRVNIYINWTSDRGYSNFRLASQVKFGLEKF